MKAKKAWLILIAVLLAIVIYVFYVRYQAQAPSPNFPKSSYPSFQGPPPGSVPYVKGPTEPPPGFQSVP